MERKQNMEKEKRLTLKEAITRGNICRIGKFWAAENVGLTCDTPFEALRDYIKAKDADIKARHVASLNDPKEQLWATLTDPQKNSARKNFAKDENYDRYESVLEYAYSFKNMLGK